MTTPPVILNQLGPEVGAALASHWSKPEIVTPGPETPPWAVDPGADILLTRPTIGWDRAPSVPPPGWPHRLRWVQTASAGVDFYPDWLLRRFPVVSTARGVMAPPIAEYVLAAILNYEKRLEAVRVRAAADWRQVPLGVVEGKTVAIAGYGSIGRAVAQRALAFGARVTGWRRSPWTEPEAGVTPVADLDRLIAEANHLVIALPLTAATRGIFDARRLALALPGLHIINIARGALIDQAALLRALDGGRLGGATLDVVDPEPPLPDDPILAHPKVLLTAHISWAGPQANIGRLSEKILANLDAFLGGEPLPDVLDPSIGY